MFRETPAKANQAQLACERNAKYVSSFVSYHFEYEHEYVQHFTELSFLHSLTARPLRHFISSFCDKMKPEKNCDFKMHPKDRDSILIINGGHFMSSLDFQFL